MATQGLRLLPVFIIGTILLVSGLVFVPWMCDSINDDNLRRTGLPARAIVLGADDTGNRYNDNPEVELRLRVLRDSAVTYDLVIRRVISVVNLVNIRKGDTIDVFIDHQDSTNVAVGEE